MLHTTPLSPLHRPQPLTPKVPPPPVKVVATAQQRPSREVDLRRKPRKFRPFIVVVTAAVSAIPPSARHEQVPALLEPVRCDKEVVLERDGRVRLLEGGSAGHERPGEEVEVSARLRGGVGCEAVQAGPVGGLGDFGGVGGGEVAGSYGWKREGGACQFVLS